MGLLFTTDYYVPTSVISRIEGDKAHLKISADEVKSSGWQDPPLGYERGEQFREHLTETPAAQVDEPPR